MWLMWLCTETLTCKIAAPFRLIYHTSCTVTQTFALLLSWNGLSRSGMKPGHSGTCCLALGFDMKQMMTLSVTAFTLPLTHARRNTEGTEDLGHRARTLIRLSVQAGPPPGRQVSLAHAKQPHTHTLLLYLLLSAACPWQHKLHRAEPDLRFPLVLNALGWILQQNACWAGWLAFSLSALSHPKQGCVMCILFL